MIRKILTTGVILLAPLSLYADEVEFFNLNSLSCDCDDAVEAALKKAEKDLDEVEEALDEAEEALDEAEKEIQICGENLAQVTKICFSGDDDDDDDDDDYDDDYDDDLPCLSSKKEVCAAQGLLKEAISGNFVVETHNTLREGESTSKITIHFGEKDKTALQSSLEALRSVGVKGFEETDKLVRFTLQTSDEDVLEI